MPFDPGDPVGSLFAEVIGLPAWQVRPGYGSFVTLEFGDPHLRITGPIAARQGSARGRRSLARRLVTVRGAWHLWIYCCDWQIIDTERPRATNESPKRTIARAVRGLDGQILRSVEVEPTAKRTTFRFDLGGELTTEPFDADSELWLLYTPSGNVLTYRADGCFSWGPGSERPDEVVWQPLPAHCRID